MRTEVRKRRGRFCRYTGTFVRYGTRAVSEWQTTQTALVREIRDSKGTLVTDHMWFDKAAPFHALRLTGGERLEFYAGAEMYTKKGDAVDYRLVRPMFMKVVR